MRQRTASWIWGLIWFRWIGRVVGIGRSFGSVLSGVPTGDPPVTVDDCARVSRALEGWLDEHDEIPERYVLEVSSPGIERPLTRPRDWERFVGEPVVVEGFGVLAERSSRLEGGAVGVGLGAGTDGSTPAWRWCRSRRAP